MFPANKIVSPSSIYRLIIVLTIGLFLFLSAITLTPGHNWGADFAQYILHAKNILSGQEYNQGIYAYQHVKGYPPGFPLLITPLLKIGGVNFILLKIVNLFFWLLNALLIFLILRRRTDMQTALLSFIYFLLSFYFFMFKQNVLSDIPFLFLCTFIVFMFDRKIEGNIIQFILIIVLMMAALSIKTGGIILFISGFAMLIFSERNLIRSMVLLSSGVLTVFLLEKLFPGSFRSYAHQQTMDVVALINDLFSHLARSYQSIIEFFIPYASSAVTELVEKFLAACSLWIFIISSAALVLKWRHGRLTFLYVFTYLYFILVASWPYDEGTRLFLPIVSLLYVGFAQAIYRLPPVKIGNDYYFSPKLLLHFLVIFGICYNMFCTQVFFGYDDDVLSKKTQQELFQWVRENIAGEEKYVFFKPPVIALLTGKTGYIMPLKGYRDARLELFPGEKSDDAKYIICTKARDAEVIKNLNMNSRFHRQWENEAFIVFTPNVN